VVQNSNLADCVLMRRALKKYPKPAMTTTSNRTFCQPFSFYFLSRLAQGWPSPPRNIFDPNFGSTLLNIKHQIYSDCNYVTEHCNIVFLSCNKPITCSRSLYILVASCQDMHLPAWFPQYDFSFAVWIIAENKLWPTKV